MICKNCSFENQEGMDFCANCGTPMTDSATELETAENDVVTDQNTVDTSEDTNDYESTQDDIPTTSDEHDSTYSSEEAVFDDDLQEKSNKKRNKAAAFSGLIALVVIVAFLLLNSAGLIFPRKYDIPVDRSNFNLSYVKDDILYIKPITGKAKAISNKLTAPAAESSEESGNMNAPYSYTVLQSSDGKTVYFLENFDAATMTGTLCVTHDSKTRIEIGTNIAVFFSTGYENIPTLTMSKDGKTLYYMSEVNEETGIGKLNMYKQGRSSSVVSENVRLDRFSVSENGKYVTYITNVPTEGQEGELKLVSSDGKNTDISPSAVFVNKVFDNGSILYFKNYDLDAGVSDLTFRKNNGNESVVSYNVPVGSALSSKFSPKYIYISPSESNAAAAPETAANPQHRLLFGNEGNAKGVILENFANLLKFDVENENFLLLQASGAVADPNTTPDYSLILKRKYNSNIILDSHYKQSPVATSLDYSTILFMRNVDAEGVGKLYMYKVGSMFGAAEELLVAEGVVSFKASLDCKVIAYTTISSGAADASAPLTYKLHVYKNKTSKEVADNIDNTTMRVSNNGEKVFYLQNINAETNTGDFYTYSTSKKAATKIDSDVFSQAFYSRNDRNAIYYKNINKENGAGDIYMWKGRGTSEKIEEAAMLLFER